LFVFISITLRNSWSREQPESFSGTLEFWKGIAC
jgi:hypothetical protein